VLAAVLAAVLATVFTAELAFVLPVIPVLCPVVAFPDDVSPPAPVVVPDDFRTTQPDE
jgi:hypothetical protein